MTRRDTHGLQEDQAGIAMPSQLLHDIAEGIADARSGRTLDAAAALDDLRQQVALLRARRDGRAGAAGPATGS